MSRIVFTALALLATGLPSAGTAQSDPEITFEVRNQGDDYVRLAISRDDWGDNYHGNWGQRLTFSDLGISAASIERDGPVSFAYVRPAGRFDCNGSAHDGRANGSCTFTINEAFSKYLADRGIERPSRNQSFSLAMSGIDSDVIDAVIKEGMGTPTPDQLAGLGIFKVTPDFVRSMAHVSGFKVEIRDLVQFKIFRITPESVKEYGALGYSKLKARDLVTFSIHGIKPDFIRGLADLGYRDITPDTLVKMRIFGVTPAYVRTVQQRTDTKPSPEELVKRRLTDMIPQNSWARDWRRNGRWNDRRSSND